MFNINERVKVSIDPDQLLGTVVGHGFFQSEHYATMSPAYIIRLDKGKWTEDRVAFINMIVVHPDNVYEIEE